MYLYSRAAYLAILIGLIPMTFAQQNTDPELESGIKSESESDSGPEPFTLTFETTYRPQITETDTDTAQYIPIPLTPDLGQIANSLASQTSVAAVMRKAQMQENTAANSRVEL